MTETTRTFDIVVATDLNRGIGRNGTLPWRLPGDLKRFRELTTSVQSPAHQNAVIMGRKTWESLPAKFRPLPGRINVVLTKQHGYQLPADVLNAESLDDALTALRVFPIENCFVIGGGQIYAEAVKHPACKLIQLTQLQSEFDCDTFFPEYANDFIELSRSELHHENEIEYCFLVLERKCG